MAVAQFTEHEISRSEVWFLAYVHPNMTISRPAKKSPLGSDQASSNLSSRYVIALADIRLMIATAVSDAQTTAANPVINIKMLNKAVNIIYATSSIGQ